MKFLVVVTPPSIYQKKNLIIDGPSQAENNGMERKRLREEQRDELLLRPLLDGTRILLSDIKGRKIMNDR